jgi:hypothetical protein
MKHLQEITESGQEIVVDEPVTHFDYSAEQTPVEWISEGALNEKYSFVSELARYVITLLDIINCLEYFSNVQCVRN